MGKRVYLGLEQLVSSWGTLTGLFGNTLTKRQEQNKGFKRQSANADRHAHRRKSGSAQHL